MYSWPSKLAQKSGNSHPSRNDNVDVDDDVDDDDVVDVDDDDDVVAVVQYMAKYLGHKLTEIDTNSEIFNTYSKFSHHSPTNSATNQPIKM